MHRAVGIVVMAVMVLIVTPRPPEPVTMCHLVGVIVSVGIGICLTIIENRSDK